ncbi:MAG: hypothetical protein K1X79_02410 [Oligoflexia bacterium]|nr:hypothetical protein [Oligoflexia bacterium]
MSGDLDPITRGATRREPTTTPVQELARSASLRELGERVIGDICALSAPTTDEAGVAFAFRGSLDYSNPVLAAHGVERENRPVICCQNFVVDASAAQLLSTPTGDAYLTFLGIGAAGPDDVVLTLKTLPGLLDYYREIGLLAPSTRVIEVTPKLDGDKLGYPFTSPLALLAQDQAAQAQLAEISEGRGRPILVGTFLTDEMRAGLARLGVDFVQQTQPALTSNKHLFGLAGKSLGFEVAPQVVISQPNDIDAACTMTLESIRNRINRGDLVGPRGWIGGWVKLSGGSGGDFVQSIVIGPEAIEQLRSGMQGGVTGDDAAFGKVVSSSAAYLSARAQVVAAMDRVRASVQDAFRFNDYGPGAEERFWPRDAFAPSGAVIIVEQDVRARGSIVLNGSNLMIVNANGSSTLEGCFAQLTGPDGDYRGSMPFDLADLGAEVRSDLQRQFKAVATLAHRLGHRGYIGVDFFVVKDAEGRAIPIMTEMNGRIPISGTAKIIADKLGASAWINVNLAAPGHEPIKDIADFRRLFGDYAVPNTDPTGCFVVPQAFRTLHGTDGKIEPSCVLKALIVGPSAQACIDFRSRLADEGFGK